MFILGTFSKKKKLTMRTYENLLFFCIILNAKHATEHHHCH